MDYLEIGPVPSDEPCQQVGTATYSPAMARAECNTFIRLIRRALGNEPTGAKLTVRSNQHDFGSYLEVAVAYDPDNAQAVAYALSVEADAPVSWDAQALAELAAAAPELLAALIRILDDGYVASWKLANEAIAKAQAKPATKTYKRKDVIPHDSETPSL